MKTVAATASSISPMTLGTCSTCEATRQARPRPAIPMTEANDASGIARLFMITLQPGSPGWTLSYK